MAALSHGLLGGGGVFGEGGFGCAPEGGAELVGGAAAEVVGGDDTFDHVGQHRYPRAATHQHGHLRAPGLPPS